MKTGEILCEMNLFHKVEPFKNKMTLLIVIIARNAHHTFVIND